MVYLFIKERNGRREQVFDFPHGSLQGAIVYSYYVPLSSLIIIELNPHRA